MARYTIANLQSDIKRKLTTSTPGASLDFYAAIDEGRRNMVKRIAPPEMIRKNYLEQAVYGDVDKYAVPEDFQYDDAIELKKLSAYRNVDTLDHPFELIFRKRFGQKRFTARNVMSINYTNGLKTASIYHPRGLKKVDRLIHNCDSLSDNGVWNIGGNIVNLMEDKLNYVEGKGSLKFDCNDSSTTGYMENSTMKEVDLFDFLQKGANFMNLSVGLPKDLLSVRLRLYSSNDDYYDFTVNRAHDANSFIENWNLLKFLFGQEYMTGTPNPKKINKIRIDITTTGKNMKDMRIDGIFARKGEVYELTYQSAFCIIDNQTGAWKHRATNGTDLLPFEDDSYQIYMLECALVLQKELYANNAAGQADVGKIEQELETAYRFYQMYHKSEVMEEYDTMYIFGNDYDGYQDDPLDWDHSDRWHDNEDNSNSNNNNNC